MTTDLFKKIDIIKTSKKKWIDEAKEISKKVIYLTIRKSYLRKNNVL